MSSGEISDDKLLHIREQAKSGTNWAAKVGYGPTCRCGLKPSKMKTGFGRDTGECHRHPEEK